MTDLLSKVRARWVVFKYDAATAVPQERTLPDGEEWVLASGEAIDALFERDLPRHRLFTKYWQAGCTGLFLVRGARWVFCVWANRPGVPYPQHLPRHLREREMGYWTFNSHTDLDFRGKGYYKRGMTQLVILIRKQNPGAVVFGDTQPWNTPVRRGLVSIGFRACGIITTYNLWIPRVGDWVLGGTWNENDAHPSGAQTASAQSEHRRSSA